jgi:glyoxylase-like metal-dependent hydrolase (beta-lactamase superfamily II)
MNQIIRLVLLFILFYPTWVVAACDQPDPKVIDNPWLPTYAFTGKESPDDPLPMYCLGHNSWLFLGSIEQLSTENRGFNGNAGFIVTDEGVVVIDALGTPLLGKRMIASIRSITDKPIRYLIMTHHHPDHYYGISPFRAIPGIQIIAHEGIDAYLDSDRFEGSVDYRKGILPEDMKGFSGDEPDLRIGSATGDKYRFMLGGQIFEVYNVGRHHSDGDLLLYHVDAGYLWVSDLVFNQRVTFIGDGHSDEAVEQLEWLKTAFPSSKLMIPGHGGAQTPPYPMLQHTYDYITRLREVMTQAIEDDVELSEALDLANFEDWDDVQLYQENHRANGSHIYRELEMELF